MNNARGYLLEYLVAQALADPTPVRVEWGPYDVRTAEVTPTRGPPAVTTADGTASNATLLRSVPALGHVSASARTSGGVGEPLPPSRESVGG